MDRDSETPETPSHVENDKFIQRNYSKMKMSIVNHVIDGRLILGRRSI
jgi:hypothetical protein